MPLRITLALAALAALCSFALAPAARADLVPPSLETETLSANSFVPGQTYEVNQSCTNGGTFTFAAGGDALGPYPGTFTESGSVTVNASGQVTAFHAEFTIASMNGMVTGTKDLAAQILGVCTFAGLAYDTVVNTSASYSARIDTSAGSFEDTGTATVNAERAESGGFAPVLGSTGEVSSFAESFDRSNGVVPAPPTGHVTGGGWILDLATTHRVSFGFEVKAMGDGWHGTCTVIDHTTKAHVHCLTVDSLVVAGTHATFSGTATVNGVQTNYQIDVDDMGEPSALGDTFAIVTQPPAPYAAGGPLGGGNIQIHTS